MSKEKRLKLGGELELIGKLGAWFIPKEAPGLYDSFKEMKAWEKKNKTEYKDYSIYIHGVLLVGGFGKSDLALLKIHFNNIGNKYKVTKILNSLNCSETDIWTTNFRNLLCSFLSDFIREHEGKTDDQRLVALTKLIAEIHEESSIQAVAGKIKNLKPKDFKQNPSLKKAFDSFAKTLDWHIKNISTEGL